MENAGVDGKVPFIISTGKLKLAWKELDKNGPTLFMRLFVSTFIFNFECQSKHIPSNRRS